MPKFKAYIWTTCVREYEVEAADEDEARVEAEDQYDADDDYEVTRMETIVEEDR